MIHVFHGFLGSPADFSFLQREDVIIHDLYEMSGYPEITDQDILLGYSMGGRIALEIAENCHFRIQKLILISAHPGLSSDEDRMKRKTFENAILERLKALSLEEFLPWWNALPIFIGDLPIKVSPERYRKSSELFEKYRLSKQVDYLPKLKAHKNKILYISGLQDQKYMDLVEKKFLPEDIKVKTIPGGHRLFQKTSELLKILQDEGVL